MSRRFGSPETRARSSRHRPDMLIFEYRFFKNQVKPVDELYF
ncbi:hypothetical protein TRIP_B10094 [uncultured Desulfatiglans sp.]|uniref:Uncharacterized protein n=1 Tax=Uncultured Desulfatiglans sp. TaxID=1748965 RepID=A0A653A001_UNCDX|nr:hypothetical protein TRIP_B10094 [uncultured Desulfatiglans sp.]